MEENGNGRLPDITCYVINSTKTGGKEPGCLVRLLMIGEIVTVLTISDGRRQI